MRPRASGLSPLHPLRTSGRTDARNWVAQDLPGFSPPRTGSYKKTHQTDIFLYNAPQSLGVIASPPSPHLRRADALNWVAQDL